MFTKETKILVVDDMMTVRKLVRMALKDNGFSNIVEAQNGNEAWQMLTKEKDYGLVISDWNMPELKGIDLLKKVRETPEIEKLPFIMLTAESESSQVLLAVQYKVSSYLVKPFTAAQVLEKLSVAYKKANS